MNHTNGMASRAPPTTMAIDLFALPPYPFTRLIHLFAVEVLFERAAHAI